MLRQFSTRRVVGSFILDWLGTLGVLLLAAYLRGQFNTAPALIIRFANLLQISINRWEITGPSAVFIPQVFILVALIWPFFFIAFSVYDGRHNATLKAELLNLLLAIVASTLTLAGVLYFSYQNTSRILFLLFFFLDLCLLLGFRITWWIYRLGPRHGRQYHRVLVVGAGQVGQRAVTELHRYAEGRVVPIGFVDDDLDKLGQQIEGLPVLGTLEQIPEIVQKHQIQDAVIALPLRAHERLVKICRLLQNVSVRIHVIPDLFALSFPNATLDGFGGIPVIALGRPGIDGWQRWLKRMFDVIVTLAILFVVWPIMLIVALFIRFDSKGPIFYRQKRIGENGLEFHMLKFRSMRIDSDDKIHREYVTRLIKENVSLDSQDAHQNGSLKLERDPRVTRVGYFIRKTSLDELPQLFNVLRGEMSLVGPRPPIPYEVALYQEWHKRRLEAIPGITGLWQVKGRNRVSFDEMVRMDLDYIEHQSVWLDLKLLLQTPFVLMRGAG